MFSRSYMNMLARQRGVIIGQKSIENDIGQHYLCNYCPKLKKLNPSPPKPLNIDIGQSISSNGSIETPDQREV